MPLLEQFFALGEKTAAAMPPPYPNPETGYRHWFHGTGSDYANDIQPTDPEEARYNPEHVRPGGTIRHPGPISVGEYGGNTDRHWNTDLGVHFASEYEMSHKFARKNVIIPNSRVAHCALHMANPKHYDS